MSSNAIGKEHLHHQNADWMNLVGTGIIYLFVEELPEYLCTLDSDLLKFLKFLKECIIKLTYTYKASRAKVEILGCVCERHLYVVCVPTYKKCVHTVFFHL